MTKVIRPISSRTRLLLAQITLLGFDRNAHNVVPVDKSVTRHIYGIHLLYIDRNNNNYNLFTMDYPKKQKGKITDSTFIDILKYITDYEKISTNT